MKTVRKSALVLVCCLAGAAPLYPMLTSASELNAVRFPEENWDPSYLAMLNALPRYLDPETDLAVAPPPLNDSDETKAELDTLREYARERRTEEQLRLIEHEHAELPKDLPPEEMAKALLEIENREPTLKLAAAATSDEDLRAEVDSFIRVVVFETGYFIMKEKKRFMRPRPTQLAPDLTTPVSVPGHPAYPSGHAGHSRIMARVLGYIDPSRASDYEKTANDIGVRREIAGLHYPSDTRAGAKMADEMFELILQNEELKAKMDDLKGKIAG